MLFLPLRQRKMKGIFKFWFSKVTRLSKQRPPPPLTPLCRKSWENFLHFQPRRRMCWRKASKVVIWVSNDFIFYSTKALREIVCGYFVPNIEWFSEEQAFSPFYDLAPPSASPPSLPVVSCLSFLVFMLSRVEPTGGKKGEGVGRSQIKWWRESLVLYKAFNILC